MDGWMDGWIDGWAHAQGPGLKGPRRNGPRRLGPLGPGPWARALGHGPNHLSIHPFYIYIWYIFPKQCLHLRGSYLFCIVIALPPRIARCQPTSLD